MKEIDLEGIAIKHMDIGLFSDMERYAAMCAMREAVQLALGMAADEAYNQCGDDCDAYQLQQDILSINSRIK